MIINDLYMCYNTHTPDLKSAMTTHLFTDEAEAPVVAYTFIGLSEDWVEGFVAIPEGSDGIARDGKGSNVHLKKRIAKKKKKNYFNIIFPVSLVNQVQGSSGHIDPSSSLA